LRELCAEYLVAGAGPAGLTIARVLARRGRRVFVVDPGHQRHQRLELLAPAALATVEALGLSPLLADPTVSRPCLGIRRHGADGKIDYEDFLQHRYRTGFVIDRAIFDERLRAAAVEAGATLCAGRVLRASPDDRAVTFRGEGGELCRASFTVAVIDATGRAALVARRMGARMQVRDRLTAELIEEVPEGSDVDRPGWLDVGRTEAGWRYHIRGANGRAQGWLVGPPRKATARIGGWRLDASSAALSEAAGESWVAVGDAAVAFDPISSQGLYNALSSAQVAAGMLLAGATGPDRRQFYSSAVLATYYRSEIGRAATYHGLQRLAPIDNFYCFPAEVPAGRT
jgi:flavin-dependent dehydrogenase